MRSVGEREHVCYRLNRVYKSWLAKRAGLAVAAAISGFVFFAPARAWSEPQPGETEVLFRRQTIYVKGSPEIKYLPAGSDGNTLDAELVLVYKEAGGGNALRTDGKSFRSRVVLVGGGGSGGSNDGVSDFGPGGGGGGGQVNIVGEVEYDGEAA